MLSEENDALRETLERLRKAEADSLIPDQRVLDLIDAALAKHKLHIDILNGKIKVLREALEVYAHMLPIHRGGELIDIGHKARTALQQVAH